MSRRHWWAAQPNVSVLLSHGAKFRERQMRVTKMMEPAAVPCKLPLRRSCCTDSCSLPLWRGHRQAAIYRQKGEIFGGVQLHTRGQASYLGLRLSENGHRTDTEV